MKIGLVDVDSFNFPNLALMKISAYHKRLKDDVSMYMPIFDYDKIYMSKVFTFTKDKKITYENIIRGGTGYDLEKKLPDEIDNIYPDYSLYNITNTAYGYLTRGCFRNCDFCIVSKKEGNKVYQAYKLNQFWNGQKKIKLLDPNISGASNFIDLMGELAETGAYIDFTQGLDLRLLTDEKMEAIKKIKLTRIHFAWDKFEDEKIICERLEAFIKNVENDYRKVVVYVLVNFNTTFEQDLYRINKIREIGASPYVMIYEAKTANKKYINLREWVNARVKWRTNKTFNEFLEKREKLKYKDGVLF
jgi:radical SAM superfamily enzyme YgiQ (UPF0313 family)